MTRRRITIPALLALLASACAVRVYKPAPDIPGQVTGLVARFPARDASERDTLCAEILRLGPAAVEDICRRVLPPGGGDDSAVRFAVNGLAVYAGRSGAESDRRLCVRGLLKSLDRPADEEVKAFLISQVELTGGREAVRPLAGYLTNERLCGPAARALTAIGGPDAASALLESLRPAPAAARVPIVKALGELKSRQAVKEILPYADCPDQALRRAALFALANIGDPAAGPVLSRSRIAASTDERAEALSLYLLFARRLVESGRTEAGAAIARDLLSAYSSPGESHVAANALDLLVSLLKDRALPDLLAAARGRDAELRAAALELAMSIPGPDVTIRWVAEASASRPEAQADILAMLGRRGDPAALPAVRGALRSPDRSVRLAAVPAAVKLGGAAVLADILPFFDSRDAKEIAAARQAVLGFDAALVVPEAACLIETVPPPGRAALISVLAEKRARDHIDLVFGQAESPEPEVRAAAVAALAKLAGEKDIGRILGLLLAAKSSEEAVHLQDAVAAAAGQNPDPERRADGLIALMPNAPADTQTVILRVLPRVGGSRALGTIVGETKSRDPAVQTAAVFALSNWPDLRAAHELRRIASTTASEKYLLLALEGYVRLVNAADFPAYRKLELLDEAAGLPKNDADRKAVLRGIGANRDPGAFHILARYLDNEILRPTAVEALLDMASEQSPEERWLSGHEAISILRRVEALTVDPAEKEQAARIISDRLRQGGFLPLFNGRGLDGWKGLVADPPARARMSHAELKKAQSAADEHMRAHWRVADGLLVFDGKGENLCTASDYGDFEMLVDWKIEKGGDSGIYLRGSPQVQIWDPVANPEGSGGLYNNEKGPRKPLKKADRPVGEWNTFRIIMIGDRVTVYFNDRMVVDNTVLENYWERDKPIYPTGQIELQAHGGPLWFRNIYIREIPREPADLGPFELDRDEGFVSLFNGRSLDGWTGDTKGYAAEKGEIVVHPERGGGNLYTEREYSDFVLRFEFRLTPAANNGIGVRAPLEGDAAYTGMEIQILEDGSPVYWDLHPYQYHGSIYGVVPAWRGVLEPVGDWNTEEITARGRQITVIVNGTTVVDADIDAASASGTIDHRGHPGLKREHGHIGFLGHGSIVEFRKIRVKELTEPAR